MVVADGGQLSSIGAKGDTLDQVMVCCQRADAPSCSGIPKFHLAILAGRAACRGQHAAVGRKREGGHRAFQALERSCGAPRRHVQQCNGAIAPDGEHASIRAECERGNRASRFRRCLPGGGRLRVCRKQQSESHGPIER